jgi:hypothetical protein
MLQCDTRSKIKNGYYTLCANGDLSESMWKSFKSKKVVTSEYVTCYKNANYLNPSKGCEVISGTVLICEKILMRVTCRQRRRCSEYCSLRENPRHGDHQPVEQQKVATHTASVMPREPLKGTVARDFLPLLFSIKRTYLGPWFMS